MRKPKLILIRSDISHHSLMLQNFVFLNKEKALSLFFDVEIITEDIKYEDLIAKHEPQIIAYFYNPRLTKMVHVFNIERYSDIPKIGILGVDEISPDRFCVIDYYEKLGMEAYFTTGSSYTHYCPAFAHKIFYWPWFILEDETHDFKLKKEYDFFLSSHIFQTYPWRQSIFPLLKENFTYNAVHTGADPVSGKTFYKLINKGYFAATCGGFCDALVMKHFEIPGSASCLITEDTEIARQAGFIDMVNCVFVNEKNAVEKISYLKHNPTILQDITMQGYNLVHQNHTVKNRTEVIDWYNLNKSKKNNEKIVQPQPFKPLMLVNEKSAVVNYTVTNTKDSLILEEADKFLFNRDYDKALKEYIYLNDNFLNYSPDFKIRLSLAYCGKGDQTNALNSIYYLINYELNENEYYNPEPIEWCVLLFILLTSGEKKIFCELFKLYNYQEYAFWNLLKDAYSQINKVIIKNTDTFQKIEFNSSHTFLKLPEKELRKILLDMDFNKTKLIKNMCDETYENKSPSEITLKNLISNMPFLAKSAVVKNKIESILYRISKYQILKARIINFSK
ncbi:MAG: glycosyltransferase [Bacteroidia bacterium]